MRVPCVRACGDMAHITALYAHSHISLADGTCLVEQDVFLSLAQRHCLGQRGPYQQRASLLEAPAFIRVRPVDG